jgi:RND family efflux transporter MFP subunit
VVLTAAGVLATQFAHGQLGRELFPTQVSTVEVANISQSSAAASLTSTGYVVAQSVSHVGVSTLGKLSRVLVKEGDHVQAGDLIAVLDENTSKAALQSAGARVTAAKARESLALANLADLTQQTERERRLLERNAVPAATLEDLEARKTSSERALAVARSEVRAALADARPAAVALSERMITAPIPGVVFSKPLNVGEVAAPGGRPVAEIFDPASLLVETDVPEARLQLAKPGSPCEIVLDAFPAKRFRGEAVEVGHRVDRAKATITIKVRFVDSTEGVIPDMSARTSFLARPLEESEKVVTQKRGVPASSVVERAGRKVVFVIDHDHLREVPVRVGSTSGALVELVEGPALGTKLVAVPGASFVDGQLVKEARNQ